MKLLIDENLSPRLVQLLAKEYPWSLHVSEVGLDACSDQNIWNYAAQYGMIIVSKDTDFHQLSLVHGAPPKLISINYGNCATSVVAETLRSQKDAIAQFASDSYAAFLVFER